MFVPCKPLLEEQAWESQDHFVCFHLLTIPTGQSHIIEVFVLSEITIWFFYISFEIAPLNAKLFWPIDWSTTAITDQQGKNYNNASPLAYLPQYHIEIIFFVGNIVDHIVISFAGSDAVFWLKIIAVVEKTRPTFREVHNIVNCSPVFSFFNPSGFCWQYWRGQSRGRQLKDMKF